MSYTKTNQIIIDEEILTVTKFDYFEEMFPNVEQRDMERDSRFIEFNNHILMSLSNFKDTGHLEEYELMKSLKKGDKVKRTTIPHPDYKYILKSVYEKLESV